MINSLNKKRFAKDLKGVICFCNGNLENNRQRKKCVFILSICFKISTNDNDTFFRSHVKRTIPGTYTKNVFASYRLNCK